jgi:hypothetical protein
LGRSIEVKRILFDGDIAGMERSESRSVVWIVFAVAAVSAVAWFFVPAFIIRPFSHQSARGIAVAMAMRQRAPWVTLASAIACLLPAWWLWTTSSRGLKAILGKVMLGVVMGLVVFSAVMARLNYFEWMFHPIPSAQFEAESASKLDAGEMVLAVKLGDDARAYPIREMAYHHILNDVVNGEPVTVTY